MDKVVRRAVARKMVHADRAGTFHIASCRSPMDLLTDLGQLAHSATLPVFRREVLNRLVDELQADVALFATAEGRVDRGLDEVRDALDGGWDALGRELAPIYLAAARDGAASDVGTLGESALVATRVYREVMAPLGGSESLFMVPSFRGRTLGVVMLGRLGGRFSAQALTRASAVTPWLSLACAAIAQGAPMPTTKLSSTEVDLLRYLQLGYSTRDIAQARDTSYFTVRNQLSALFRKLGVANRTEAVGLRLAL